MNLLSSLEENHTASTSQFGLGHGTHRLEAETSAHLLRSRQPKESSWQAAERAGATGIGQAILSEQAISTNSIIQARHQPARSRWTLHPLQEWEGYVIEFNDEEFIARLVDVTAGDQYESEEVTIPTENLSFADASSLKLGKFFRWVIGYERSESGSKRLVSEVVFRKMPGITQRDIDRAREWAERKEAFLNG